MSTQGLAQIWSLDQSIVGEDPRAPKFDIWAVNHMLYTRALVNNTASQLNAIPSSETRLRDEGIIPFYSYLRKLISTLKSSAREQGVTVPEFPDPPADWREEVSTDCKSLAALFRPHLTEPVEAAVDWNFSLRDRDPKPHWASEPATNYVAIDLSLQLLAAMDKVLVGSEWGPYKALLACNEIKWIARVMGEELLRIRAQPGSGWDEEEAKEMVKGQLTGIAGLMSIGA